MDEDGWFSSLFVMGPGLQMAQKFIENIFDKHVDWIEIIENDDNYKNILQVIIQKRYKITPSYLPIRHDADTGYTMGVYVCIGQSIHSVDINNYINIDRFGSFEEVDEFIMQNGGRTLLFLGKGQHKIKRKSEQLGCFNALQIVQKWAE